MSPPILTRILRTNVILGVVATAIAGLLWGTAGTLAAGVGALLACADFAVLARLGGRAVAAARSGASPWGLGLALIGKMAALFVAVFLAIRVAKLAVLPFALGFSVFVVSILLVGLRAGALEAEPR
jgi:ATP synthase I chain